MIATAWIRTLSLFACMALATTAMAQDGPPDRGQRGQRGGRGPQGPSPVMKALDADEDSALSTAEIADAARALLTLDTNGDGNLTTDELRPPQGEGGRGGRGGGRGGFGPSDPIMAALDQDDDGELFEDEVTDAATYLLAADTNNDGMLDAEELTPQGRGGFGGRGGGRGGPGGGRGGRGGDGGEGGPVPRPEELTPEDAVPFIPDRVTFKELSYQGPEVMVDAHLAGLEFVKIQLEGGKTDDPRLYFMNTNTHRSHPGFMGTLGITRNNDGQMRGVIVYWPMLTSPSGNTGLYTIEFEPNDEYSVEEIQLAMSLIESHSDLMRGNLAYHMLPRAKQRYEREQEQWDNSGIPLFEEGNRYDAIGFLPLHVAEGYGRLRLMTLEERPAARDVVIYPTLPNEMPRVAGIITAVQQTPLSHVNLRAVQDDVPNAFVADALTNAAITGLIGKYVYYRVAQDGYEIREATREEYDSHFADQRPTQTQIPPRDLSVRVIRSFDQIGFDDAHSVGVKAANLAALRKLDLHGTGTPDGFAVPFSFYDEFMRHNGFDKLAADLQKLPEFQQDAEVRAAALEQLQDVIKKGKMPDWMMDALAAAQRAFPQGTSIRCRSSTNNEDLPGFSGAGLYDSYTHHPDEGHIEKSIKQVYASLWNYRAFEERAFYRIDHNAAAMGVVLHANTDDEQANGVAVTRDILYQTYEQVGVRYYINAQLGEDLVTNPESNSVPEELLISPRNPRTDKVIHRSSLTRDDQAVIADEHLRELRRALRIIDTEFRKLYKPADDEPFAMEVEFKVTVDGDLFIKQARPWVF